MAKYTRSGESGRGRGNKKGRQNSTLRNAVIAMAMLLAVLLVCVLLLEIDMIGPNQPTEPTAGPTQDTSATPTDPTENKPTTNTAPSIGFKDPATAPTDAPTDPTMEPTAAPTEEPTVEPTTVPTVEPTSEPTTAPTDAPSTEPTEIPTQPTEPPTRPTEPPTQPPTDPPTSPTEPDLTMDRGLEIVDIGWYTGEYLEDGSNESVENILMILLANNGDEDIQYAEITLQVNGEPARFTVTTLPAGENMILLEQNRMPFVAGASYTDAEAANVAVFKDTMDTKAGQLKIQGLNGAVNVTNISGKDIEGDIVIYYKNVYGGTMYGGITYRITIQGGLKAGQIRQIMTRHFITDVSRIMFVTIDGQ